MRELQRYVTDICEKGRKPRGFNADQCRILIDVYNELIEETRVFLRDKQVFCLLKNRFHFPGKDKGDGFFIVWRKDLIVVVK